MNTLGVISLAWNNLWRNGRRSAVTLLSLGFGFAAVALFAGYTSAIYEAIARASIHGELIGHLTIAKTGWQSAGRLHPAKYLLTEAEIAKATAVVQQRLPGSSVVPKLGLTGLLSNGRSSTIFTATGIVPHDLDLLRGPFRHGPGGLGDERPAGVTVAAGLADILGLHSGDSASILASTIHGQANAADADIGDIVDTGNLATNDKLMFMPLAMARSLLDADRRAESLTVLVPSQGANQSQPGEAEADAMRDALLTDFGAAGLDLEVRTWQQMSAFYRQVKTMYDMIFNLIFCVVIAIVVLSVANAMSMAVVERTREIGTLRAIGMKRRGITTLFVGEALVLVAVGMAAGLALGALIRVGVNVADIRYVPPGNTSSVPMYIGFDAARTALAGVALALLAVLAAFVPARRAAHRSITESLGHV